MSKKFYQTARLSQTPAVIGGWDSDDETPSDEQLQPDDPVPPAIPPVREGAPTRALPGIPPGDLDDTDTKCKETNPQTVGPPRHPGPPGTRPPARPATPGQFSGPPRDSETSHRRSEWVPLVPPGQAKVNVKDATPRSPTERNRTFGERPATGHVEFPGHDHDDEVISNRNPQSHAIGYWGEGYAFRLLEAELSSRHPEAEVVRN